MKLIATIIINLFVIAAFAQTTPVKIGYTNAEYIALSHPDYKIIMKQLQEHKNRLDMMLQEKYQQYQQLEQEYNQMRSSATADQFMVKDKEQQVMNKQSEIQQFQQGAEQQMMKKQQELMVPLQNKIQEAIEATAKAGGYTHIFNGESMLWMMNAESYDITDDVLKHMGISVAQQPLNTGSSAPANGATPPPSMLEVR
jgi:outer membrane protein